MCDIDFTLRRFFVIPSNAVGCARWYGQGRGLSFEFAQGVREVLLSDEVLPEWSKRCRDHMESLREQYRAEGVGSTGLIHDATSNRTIWWSFAGRFLNEAFSMVLKTEAGIDAKADDYRLLLQDNVDDSRVRELICSLLNNTDAMRQLPISQQWIDGLKFTECLPHPATRSLRRVAGCGWV